ncbi:MAG: site-specific integrase [Planctomycetes bacterium]|nr:site-specific integrase [Planctomycetota bacterium]
MPRTSTGWYDDERGLYMAWVGGKRHVLFKGPKNRANAKAAAQKLDDLRYQARHNPTPAVAEQNVASVIEAYLAYAADKIAASSLAVRKPYLQSFAEYCGPQTMPQCSPEDLEDWLEKHPEWRSDWTKNGAVRSVHRAFNWAASRKVMREGRKVALIRENPFRGFTHRAGAARRDMTPDEFRSILRISGFPIRERGTRKLPSWKKPTPGARFRQVLLYLWLTGSRPSEAAKLTWDQVDFDNALVVLETHKTIRMQKTPQPRVIPLDPVVMRLLRWLQNRHEGPYVFLSRRKTPWDKDTLAQRLRRARKGAGIPDDVKLYGTRHAFGTRAILSGVDIKTTSALLGHTTTRVTERYLHVVGKNGHLADAMLLANGRRRGA